MDTKICSKCKQAKYINLFYHNEKLKCKRDSWCKICKKDSKIKKYNENKDFIKQNRKKFKNKDLTNIKFGKLLVVGKAINYKTTSKRDKKQIHWECKCQCGNIVFKTTANLIGLRVSSCGCSKNQKGPSCRGWRGFGEISGRQWSTIIAHARIKKLEFLISKEYAWNLFIQQDRKCALTGELISFDDLYKKYENRKITASLDRIDSSKGYIEGNIQWVHKDANKIKSNINEKCFFNFCKMVYFKLKDKYTSNHDKTINLIDREYKDQYGKHCKSLNYPKPDVKSIIEKQINENSIQS